MDIVTSARRYTLGTPWNGARSLVTSPPGVADVLAVIRQGERIVEQVRAVERWSALPTQLIEQQQLVMATALPSTLTGLPDIHFTLQQHLRTIEFAYSNVVLLQNTLRTYQNVVGESVRRLLVIWSEAEDLPARVRYTAALRVRQHLLSSQGIEKAPIEDFAFNWLGLSRPVRAEERAALLDAVIEALLNDDWHGDPAAATRVLRRQVNRAHQVMRPEWTRQINKQSVRCLDEPVPGLPGEADTTLIHTLSGVEDVERTVIGAQPGPVMQYLLTVLKPTEFATVVHYADNLGQITWDQAAALAGHPASDAEKVRRKVKRYAQLYRPSVR